MRLDGSGQGRICQQTFTICLQTGDIDVYGAASNEHAQQIFRFQQNRVADWSGRRHAGAGEIGSRKI
jgi:hypothetical protein